VKSDDAGDEFMHVFEKVILNHAQGCGATMVAGANGGLREIARLDALYCLLEWEHRPKADANQYMSLQDFKDRNVLPTPHRVLGRTEPDWSGELPAAKSGGQDRQRHDAGGGGGAAAGGGGAAGTAGGGPAVDALDEQFRRAEAARRRREAAPINRGQTRAGTLVRQDDGRWAAKFEVDDRLGDIENQNAVPDTASPGDRAEFYITKQNRQGGSICRVQRAL
jgi:hypothetical protein